MLLVLGFCFDLVVFSNFFILFKETILSVYSCLFCPAAKYLVTILIKLKIY